MKLIDTMNGPVWVVWAVGVLCAAISLLLICSMVSASWFSFKDVISAASIVLIPTP